MMPMFMTTCCVDVFQFSLLSGQRQGFYAINEYQISMGSIIYSTSKPAKFSDRSSLVCSVLLLALCVLEHGMGSNEVKRTFQSLITEEIFVSLTF